MTAEITSRKGQPMLFEPLFSHAARQPEKIAIQDDTGTYTFHQLAGFAAGLGQYLAAQTSKPHVGILLPSSAGFVASFYGTLLAGKTAVPINFLLGEREIAHIIRDSGIDTVITVPLLAGRLKDSPLKIIDLTQLPKTPPTGVPRFPSVKSDDLAVLLYTSGTSGLPKGVMLSYSNLQTDVEASIAHAHLQDEHKFLGVVPLFHSTGLMASMIAPIHLGSTTVYIARFSPVGTIKAIREHAISVIAAVPSMYATMVRLKEAGPEDVKSLYAALSGGEPLPQNVREAFGKKFDKPLLEGYGLTETIGPVAFNTPQEMHPGSVGQLIPGVTIQIVDESNQPLPQGQIGEIWLKGPMIMHGYYHLPEESAKALTPDGFFKTGDLGRVDEDNYLYITGRKKDLIIVSGEKVYPREIEDLLSHHPAIACAAVVGKKDPSRGETVVAFVQLRDGQSATPESIRDYCRQQGLVPWKCPREVIILPELPHSPTGKILKRQLVEQLNAAPAAAPTAAHA